MTSGPGTTPARSPFPWLFVAALMLAALNLRAPFVGVSAVTDEIRAALDISGGEVGLLTSLPVLCFGLAAPVALLVIRRFGAESAVLLCLGGVVVGSLVRSGGSFAAAVAGTVVIGLGITIGNIVVPVLIRRGTPAAYAGAVTGMYTAVMNVGSMAVLLTAAPLAGATSWRFALVVPTVVALVAIVAWRFYVLHDRRRAAEVEEAPVAAPVVTGPVWRNPVVLLLAVAFAGQATSYYSLTAWLPSVLADEAGASAGAAGGLASVFQVSAIIGALGVPLLALRVPEWLTVVAVGALWFSFPLQLLVAPEAHLVGSVLGGIAQGGGFAAIFSIVVRVSRTDRESAATSTLVQGSGYVVAALGPTLLGVLHDSTDAWAAPLTVVLVTTATFTVAGTAAALLARRRTG